MDNCSNSNFFTIKLLSLLKGNTDESTSVAESANADVVTNTNNKKIEPLSVFDVWAKCSIKDTSTDKPFNYWWAENDDADDNLEEFATLSEEYFFDYSRSSKAIDVNELNVTSLVNSELSVDVYICPKGEKGKQSKSTLVACMESVELSSFARSGSHTGFYSLSSSTTEKAETEVEKIEEVEKPEETGKTEDSITEAENAEATDAVLEESVTAPQNTEVEDSTLSDERNIAAARVALITTLSNSQIEIDLSMSETLKTYCKEGRVINISEFSILGVSSDFVNTCAGKPLQFSTKSFGIGDENGFCYWQVGGGEFEEVVTDMPQIASESPDIAADEEAGTEEAKGESGIVPGDVVADDVVASDTVEGDVVEGDTVVDDAVAGDAVTQDSRNNLRTASWGNAAIRVFLSNTSIEAMIDNDDDFVSWQITLKASTMLGTSIIGNESSRPSSSKTDTTDEEKLTGKCDFLNMFEENVKTSYHTCKVRQHGEKEMGSFSCRVSYDEPIIISNDEDKDDGKSLADLIPPRIIKLQPSSSSARESFGGEVRNVVSLVLKHVVEESAGNNITLSAKDLRRQVMYRLNESGDYYLFKEKLKRSIVKVVKESRAVDSSIEPQSDLFLASVYEDLLNESNVTLNQLVNAANQGGPMLPRSSDDIRKFSANNVNTDGSSNDALYTLAAEAEMNGDENLAQSMFTKIELNAERLPSCDESERDTKISALIKVLICEANCFLKFKNRDAAIETLLKVLALDINSLYALKTIAALYLTQGDLSKASLFIRFALSVKSSVEKNEENSDISGTSLIDLTALLRIVHFMRAENNQDLRRFKHKYWPRISRGGLLDQFQSLLDITNFLLDINLVDIAKNALSILGTLQRPEKASSSKMLIRQCILEGRCMLQCDDLKNAERQFREALEMPGHGSLEKAKIFEFLGHINFEKGMHYEAQNCYEATLEASKDDNATSLSTPAFVYMRLGNLYLLHEKYVLAREIFLRICRPYPLGQPSATLWLGVGISCMKLGDLAAAEDALVEANILDRSNPQVWGQLALLCKQWKPERLVDGAAALEQALKLGLGNSVNDSTLIEELNSN